MRASCNFYEAIVSGFRNVFNFRDRASRSEFWWWVLFKILIAQIIFFREKALLVKIQVAYPIILSLISLLLFLAIILLCIASLSMSVRRLHDIDFSGRWLLLVFIPLLGALILLCLYCHKGNDHSNCFGEPRSFSSNKELGPDKFLCIVFPILWAFMGYITLWIYTPPQLLMR